MQPVCVVALSHTLVAVRPKVVAPHRLVEVGRIGAVARLRCRQAHDEVHRFNGPNKGLILMLKRPRVPEVGHLAISGPPMALPYHVVVWGATGFVGQLVCEALASKYSSPVRL